MRDNNFVTGVILKKGKTRVDLFLMPITSQNMQVCSWDTLYNGLLTIHQIIAAPFRLLVAVI